MSRYCKCELQFQYAIRPPSVWVEETIFLAVDPFPSVQVTQLCSKGIMKLLLLLKIDKYAQQTGIYSLCSLFGKKTLPVTRSVL